MIEDNYMNVKEKVVIVEQALLNSYAFEGCGHFYRPGDLVVHNPSRGFQNLIEFLHNNHYKQV